jgi:hypothetical protein
MDWFISASKFELHLYLQSVVICHWNTLRSITIQSLLRIFALDGLSQARIHISFEGITTKLCITIWTSPLKPQGQELYGTSLRIINYT